MSKEELRKKLYGMTTQIHDGDAYQQSIWQAIADALEPIDRTVKETVDGIFIDKSTWELDFWEELYGLEPSGSLEDRKSAVKSNIRMNPTMTTEVFENIVSSWKGAEVEVEEFYDEYRIEVRFTDPNETPDDMDALVDFMYEILPAHLAMSVGYKYIRIKDVHNKLTSEQMERLAMSTFATPEDYEVDGGYYTDRLDLYNRDPIDDADRLFDLQAMLNDNWDKIDKNVALLKDLDKHINDEGNPHNVTSEQVTVIPTRTSDVGVGDYPIGVSAFHTKDANAGYPWVLGTVLTVKATDNTAFQFFSRNGYQTNEGVIQKGVWYRVGHSSTGWLEWEQSLNENDAKEIQNTINNLTKKDVGLGNVDNVKQATKTEFDNHKKELGNYQNAGHVKLSNSTNSQSSVSDGVAATPKAVKDAYDHAGDAHTKISKHVDNKNNPHDVTKSQVGLGNVANYKVATEAQAMAGTSNTAYMTPLRTSQYVKEISGESASGVLAELNKHKGDKNNPHNVTKEQIGLGNVANYSIATESQAITGTSNSRYMTPKTTMHAIDDNRHDVFIEFLPSGAPLSEYPLGVSQFLVAGQSGHGYPLSYGTVITNKSNASIAVQQFYENGLRTQTKRYTRFHHGSNPDGWTEWVEDVGDDRLSNSTSSNSSYTVATSKAVKDVNDAIGKHAGDKSNPHNVTKSQVGLGNVDNVKQATKTEFDRHVGQTGSFGGYGHVKLSNHTTSENSVGDGVAATPLAVKTVNDKLDTHTGDKSNPHNVTSEQVTLIDPKKSSVLMNTYPDGVTMFYFEEDEAGGYPHRIGTVLTVKGVDKTAFQIFARNGFNRASEHIWYRTGHITQGWSDWYQVLDQDDYDEIIEIVADTEKSLEDKIEELQNSANDIIDAIDKEEPKEAYPDGVTAHYVSRNGDYPQNFGTALNVKASDLTMLQLFSENNVNADRRELYFRQLHANDSNSDFRRVLTEDDKTELEGLVDEIYSKGSELHNDITWLPHNSYIPDDFPEAYPTGITAFRTNNVGATDWDKLTGSKGNSRYIITTYRDRELRTVMQKIVRMHYNSTTDAPFDAVWYRTAFNLDSAWSKPVRIANHDDVAQAQKTADEAVSKIPKLSSSVTSTSTSVGANSYAVKKAYDKANEALTRGDEVKKDLVASLSPSGLPVSVNDSFETIISKIKKNDLKSIKTAVVTLESNQKEVRGLSFRPDFILPLNGSSTWGSVGYGVSKKGEGHSGRFELENSTTGRAVTMRDDGFVLSGSLGSTYIRDNKFLVVGGFPIEEYRVE